MYTSKVVRFDDDEKYPPLANPLTAARQDADDFNQAAFRALSRFKLTVLERDELLTLIGQKGATERLLASNKALRLQSTKVMAEELVKARAVPANNASRRFWNVSFLGPLINEYQPELDVDAYRKAIDQLLRNHSLNALFAIELQPLTNYPQKKQGRSFLLNAHAFAWIDDQNFSAEDAQDAMNASDTLWNEFGADNVRFTERTTDEGQIEYLAYYLTKAPAKGKRRRRDPHREGRWQLYPVRDVRDDLQLRLMEILTHLELTDLIWGVNDGKFIRKRWKAALVRFNRARCRGDVLDSNFNTAELWSRVRARSSNGSKKYSAPEFYGPRPRPVSCDANPRNGGARRKPSKPDPRPKSGAASVSLRDFIKGRRKTDLDD